VEGIERLREQILPLITYWQMILPTEPAKVAREARTYLRWIETADARSADGELTRSLLIETCIFIIAAAEARRSGR
jgi:hypothetical protein